MFRLLHYLVKVRREIHDAPDRGNDPLPCRYAPLRLRGAHLLATVIWCDHRKMIHVPVFSTTAALILLVACEVGGSGNEIAPIDVDLTVDARVAATVVAVETVLSVPPTPTSDSIDRAVEAKVQATMSAVEIAPTAAPTPTASAAPTAEFTRFSAPAEPTLDFEGLRALAVQHLLEDNRAWVDYRDSIHDASIFDDLNPIDANLVIRTREILIQVTLGFRERIDSLTPPVAIPELVELHELDWQWAETILMWQIENRNGVSGGVQSDMIRNDGSTPLDELIDLIDRMDMLKQNVLAKFNIPDDEVEYVRYASEPEIDDYETEAMTVQAAMDLYMADTGLAPAAQAVATDDMSSSTPALAPTYLSSPNTSCTYTWTATTGIVTQVACPQ